MVSVLYSDEIPQCWLIYVILWLHADITVEPLLDLQILLYHIHILVTIYEFIITSLTRWIWKCNLVLRNEI